MKYRIITTFLLLVAMACGEADKVPKGILPKEKMRDVLLDMNMADAYSSDITDVRVPLTDSVRQQRAKLYYRQVLQLHGLSVQEFMNSYRFYESHPDRLKEVYDMMLEIASSKRNALDLDSRRKEYLENPQSLLPVGKKALISGKQDTIIPFVKRVHIP